MFVAILDGYIDEPSSLGVPPFISPIARYIAGSVLDSGHDVDYYTIDQYRSSSNVKIEVSKADLLVIIAGVSVPGKYIHGAPMSKREVLAEVRAFKGVTAVAGHMTRDLTNEEKEDIDLVLTGDPDAQVHDSLKGGLCSIPPSRKRTAEEWQRWSVGGASIIEQHPDHPRILVAEVDVYKGCPRFHKGGCSFCSEMLEGPPRFRGPEEIGAEVKALSEAGVVNFRLACSCIVSYKADGLKEGDIVPNPDEVGRLLKAVTDAADGMRVLHVDNADPAVIARNPEEGRKVLEHLVLECTSGNILSLGMESADPAVIEANDLNSTPDEVLDAIRTINKVGGARGPTGLPFLLPGLNFIAGLDGETSRTYQLDLDFLKRVLDEGLLLRRINIRQVLEHRRKFPGVKKRKDFMRFRTAVREGIDHVLLQRLLPRGTVLRDVYIERWRGKTAFARQVGTYPILIGIPGATEIDELFDVAIVDWGMRSVTAVPYPLDVNEASIALLLALPGIGKKRAARIVRGRPYLELSSLKDVLDDPELFDSIREYLLVVQSED